MGDYTFGTANYNYTITIDLEKIIESITDKLKGHMDDCEWETDCDYVIVHASDTAKFRHYHCDATRLDPPEDDTELFDSIEDVDVEQLILDALHETQSIKTEVEVDYEGIDYEIDMPDEDRAYDEWRDRQFEGDD